MNWIIAGAAGLGIFLLAVPNPGGSMAASLEQYLAPRSDGEQQRRWRPSIPAGGTAAAIAGVFVGMLVAQGDLFLAGRSRSTLALSALGGAAGWVLWSMHRTNAQQRRARTLRYELPVMADAMALHIVAGESIVGTIRSVVDQTNGVAADELRTVLDDHDGGEGIPEALATASHATAHPAASRLYEALSHAHTTGGRLAEALGDLATDYRSGLERDLTSEGGRRAVATYGPVLVLMVPTALVFLIYPTLLGLRALSGAP